MTIKILNEKDKKLRQVSSEVTDFDNPIYKEMIDEIKEICIKEKAYASAAPQFGILKRFILIMTVEEIKLKDEFDFNNLVLNYDITPYFNPKITSMMGCQYYYEACMSVNNAIGKVKRPYKIELTYQDINGFYHEKIAEDFEAIVLCHEIDHLDGIEYIDKADDMHYNALMDERIRIRNEHEREIISKIGDFDQSDIKDRFKTRIYKKK